MFSDFPNLHPLVVHFPIVLILLSVVLQGLLVFKDSRQLRWGTLIMMGVAFASALVASKIFHAHTTQLPPLANAIYQDHERYAEFTLWFSGLTFLLRGIGEFYRINRRSYESLVLASALAAAAFLSLTGHRGAQLVYLAGVGPQGNLVLTDNHIHEDSTLAGNQPGSADPSATGHQGQHGDHATGHQGTPAGQSQEAPRPMDHGSSHAVPGRDNVRGASPAGHDMSHGQMPVKKPSAGTAGNHSMAGMNHPKGHTPARGQAPRQGMTGMDHPMPATTSKAKGKENMAGMDHSQMRAATTQKPAQDHAAMGHGTIPAQGNKPTGTHTPGMPGMDHQAMPARDNQPPMGNMEGSSGMNTKTDMNGRPLIDPTVPYDNNPAREQAKPRPQK